VHVGKLGQVTNFAIAGFTAKHRVDQHMVLFRYCSLGGDTAMPGGLHVLTVQRSVTSDMWRLRKIFTDYYVSRLICVTYSFKMSLLVYMGHC